MLLAALAAAATACGGSNDEGLEDLQIAGATLSPDFAPHIFDYTAEVPNDLASTTVTAAAGDDDSTIEVNQRPVASGSASQPIDLAVGENTISIVVIADDGDREAYTVVVTRLPPPSDDPSLAGLRLTAADLDQIFDPDITTYTAATGYLGTSTRVVAEPEAPRATLELAGEPLSAGEASAFLPLEVGGNTVEIEVTAEDGSATRAYEVAVERSTRSTLDQRAYVKASNTGPDRFGTSLDISGGTVVVGAPGEGSAASGIDGNQGDNSLADAGAVYVFDRTGSTWVQSAYVKASNPGDPDRFGGAAAIDGDLLAAGAEGEQSRDGGIDGDERDDSGSFVGAVYAFVRDGAGEWSQEAYLKAANPDDGDRFGAAVDVDGRRIIVGAWSEDSDASGVDGDGVNDNLPGAGAAYVFARDEDGTWSQEAYLKASNTGGQDEFGRAVAISGRTAAVGAPEEGGGSTGVGGDGSDNSRSSAGAVYLFESNGDGRWEPAAYVKASNTDAGDRFGADVALDGDLLAVGAPGEAGGASARDGNQQDDSVSDAGAVYVFERDAGGDWSQVAYVKASNPGFGDAFGASVTLSGNLLAVAAPGERSAASGLDGDQADRSASGAGAVYVFERDEAGGWRQLVYVKASNPDSGDGFGSGLAFYGDTLAVSSPSEDGGDTGIGGDDGDDSVTDAGAVYVFR